VSPPVRVGVLGAGFISDYHVAGLRTAGADVVAIFGRTLARARARAAQYGIPVATDCWQDVVERDDVEAVVVATPDFTHEPLAVAAARAGKAVLLQKPMARTAAECLRIIEAADKAGTLLCVSFVHRHLPEVAALRALLARGALGRVLHVRHRNATRGADWAAWFYSRAHVGGGALLQLGVHGIDLLRHCFGEVEAVQGTIATTVSERRLADGTRVVPDNEDLVLATYRFASGLHATHEVSYAEVAGTDRFRCEVYGEAGTAWLRTERGRLAVFASGDAALAGRPESPARGPGPGGPGAAGAAPGPSSLAPATSNRGGEWVALPLESDDTGPPQHRHFVAMVRGEVPADGTDRAGLASVVVAEAVYRAAASGRWEIPQWP
jgi:myo-inositol 2-dehydrogenase/D-chiro-inositol 1-dehydrogenase